MHVKLHIVQEIGLSHEGNYKVHPFHVLILAITSILRTLYVAIDMHISACGGAASRFV